MPTRADPLGAWFSLGLDMWMLGAEASSVIALRTMKLAAGGAAASEEAGLMIGEKVTAAMALAQQATLGQLGTSMPGIGSKAVAHYRRRVRANRKRLSRP
ncbi:hypothetical protein ACFSCW_09980 [Sphingomonas tabacisoli]|uniref:Antifreeze protein n=1 Tax=Sphingomonas tabacisoli TaxID=2249466 RepID=A0ABW4I2N8_9SPHN